MTKSQFDGPPAITIHSALRRRDYFRAGPREDPALTVLPVNYPVTLRMQAFSFSARIHAVDAQHQPVCSAAKKRFKFREHVTVLDGSPNRSPLGEIRAEPTNSSTLRYSFTLPQGQPLGAISRCQPGEAALFLVEEASGPVAWEIVPGNPRARLLDRCLARIHAVRLFSASLFRPAFSIRAPNRGELFRLQKLAAPLETRYLLRPSAGPPPFSPLEETRLLLAVLMTLFLEG